MKPKISNAETPEKCLVEKDTRKCKSKFHLDVLKADTKTHDPGKISKYVGQIISVKVGIEFLRLSKKYQGTYWCLKEVGSHNATFLKLQF